MYVSRNIFDEKIYKQLENLKSHFLLCDYYMIPTNLDASNLMLYFYFILFFFGQ